MHSSLFSYVQDHTTFSTRFTIQKRTTLFDEPVTAFQAGFNNDGKLVPNYDYDPDDHYSKLGAVMQEYLNGDLDRQGLADAVEEFWASSTPVQR